MSYKNIDTIYLDMDGVLTAFEDAVESYDAYKDNGSIDWAKIKEIGFSFWSEMPWLPEGLAFYKHVVEFCKKNNLKLGILSAIYSNTGKAGKRAWVKKYCKEIDENLIIICDKGVEKRNHLPANGLLIDDDALNCCLCENALLYEDPVATMINLEKLFTNF